MVLSVAPFSFADLTWGGGTCVRPPHSQPEERIVIIRQEEANPMKTVATLLAGSRNGEADVGGGKSSPK